MVGSRYSCLRPSGWYHIAMGIKSKAPNRPSPARRVATWKYLWERPESGRRQVYVEGSRLPASSVWISMSVNGDSRERAAENWDLPLEAIDEIIRYCEAN